MAGGNVLSKLSLQEIQSELARRRRGLPALHAKRRSAEGKVARAQHTLDGINELIAMLGGASAAPAKRGVGRPRGSKSPVYAASGRRGGPSTSRRAALGGMSLVEALRKALAGKQMRVTDAVSAVRTVGYNSASPNLRVMVNQALINKKNKSLFRKISRGVYTAA